MSGPKPMLIGGEWIADSGQTIVSVNPANGEVNYEVCAAASRQVEAAVDVAHRAAASGAWRNMLPHQRARLLAKLADIIEARGEDLARTQMRENGKVLAECRAQAGSAAAIFRYYAAVCETLESEVTPARGQYLSMTVYEPYGVVAAITPWNSPLTMEAQKVAPALAAGNAVILKPSEVTPSAGLALGQAALDAGIPPGILNVLPGTGAVAGDALVRHPGVKFVSFTGGTASGRRIAAVSGGEADARRAGAGWKVPAYCFRRRQSRSRGCRRCRRHLRGRGAILRRRFAAVRAACCVRTSPGSSRGASAGTEDRPAGCRGSAVRAAVFVCPS